MNKHTGITPDTLKYIALTTMFIDHVATGLIDFLVKADNGMVGMITGTQFTLRRLGGIMNAIGRIAFPIFAYQLVQGFIFTKSRKKYALNLLISAIISEIPFDMCFFRKIPYFRHQNVMFELLTGIILLSILEYTNEKICDIDFAHDTDVWKMPFLNKFAAIISDIAIALLFLIPAQLLHFDYGGKGIILIASLYILYRNRELMVLLCPVLFIASFYPVNMILNHAGHASALQSVINEIPSCIAFFLIYFDNGIRKIKGRRKYIFYAFYPAHLIILWLIRQSAAYAALLHFMTNI